MGKKLSRPDKSNNSIKSSKVFQTKTIKPHDYQVPLPPPNFNIYYYRGDRKYINLSDINYLYPVDDNEIDRMQNQHYLCRHVWGDNYSAPIKKLLGKNDTKILDVGCGPATWTLEMATDYAKSKFTGIDIAPTYPIHTKPCNVEFLQANILTGLPYADETFDYVICRLMIFAFTLKDWEIAIREICRVCKVGGYVEFMEKDILFWNEGNFTRNARTCFAEELRTKKKIESVISPRLPRFISKTKHFPIIYHAERNIPIGKWGGKLGEYYEYMYEWGAKNLRNVMKDCGYNEKEWDSIVENVMEELSYNHGYDKIHRIWAKKEEFQPDMEESTIIEEGYNV
ncbi:18879_t:CDS:2 [Funneliformis geosporum]|nr:18879_t:CDS:2 [Funneliformis geosporum]